MIQILNFEQADEARKLTDCSHNHVLHGLVKLRRESDETGRVRQRADASFPGHPDVGVFLQHQIHCMIPSGAQTATWPMRLSAGLI